MFSKKNIYKIQKDGILILENFYDKNECKKLVKYSEELLLKLTKKSKFSKFCQVINSPFQYNSSFYKYVLNEKIDFEKRGEKPTNHELLLKPNMIELNKVSQIYYTLTKNLVETTESIFQFGFPFEQQEYEFYDIKD